MAYCDTVGIDLGTTRFGDCVGACACICACACARMGACVFVSWCIDVFASVVSDGHLAIQF